MDAKPRLMPFPVDISIYLSTSIQGKAWPGTFRPVDGVTTTSTTFVFLINSVVDMNLLVFGGLNFLTESRRI